jgi:hypothetical protein
MKDIDIIAEKAFGNANKEMTVFYGSMGEKALLAKLEKSIYPCNDDFSKKQGKKYTISNSKKPGSILHFKNKQDVLFYLIDCCITRKWLEN